MVTHKEKAAEFANEHYRIAVTGRHVHVTDAMRNYAVEKVRSIEHVSPRMIDVSITMDIQKLEHRISIMLTVYDVRIAASAATHDMYASIDKAVDTIKRRLRKYKTRLQNHQGRCISSIDMNVQVLNHRAESDIDEINEAIEGETERELIEAYAPHHVVSHETMPLKQLTTEEAIMKLELAEEPFMLYIDEATEALQVIYRRRDGHFGVVHPITR